MKIDLLVKNAQVYNSYFKGFTAGDIAVKDGKILYVGDAKKLMLEPERVLELAGKYVIPGLIDCHMHIESSMTTPSAFAQEVVRDGVTTIIAEPHEIANVFGLEGIRAMIEDAKGCPVDIRIAIPSSVPSTNAGLETTGAVIGEGEVAAMLDMEEVICLGEVMNCREVIRSADSKSSRLIRQVQKARPYMPIEGHCPAFMDWELACIAAAGIHSDHTEMTVEGLRQRIAAGIFIELQDKTLRPELIAYLKEHQLFEHFAIVTDDTMPDVLVERGHLNALVKKAIELGLTPEQAIYVTTFTPARRMGLSDKGSLAPGKSADFVVLDDPRHFRIEQTYLAGQKVYACGAPGEHESVRESRFPKHFFQSVHLREMTAQDFCLHAEKSEGTVRCRVLCVQDGTTFVQQKIVELPVHAHEIQWEDSPYALAVAAERHGKNGGRGYALVSGDVLRQGAAATTYAHDHHNLLILGQNKEDMAAAANHVIQQQGGYAVVRAAGLLAFAHLPIAGILSDAPVDTLAKEMHEVQQALHGLGYNHYNVIMSLSTLGLPVSPFFKVTDKGIVDVKKQCIVPFVME